ncbi:MAG TPA: hypothetical protein VF940_04085, partial [Streptosporangiaceae bacterium]
RKFVPTAQRYREHRHSVARPTPSPPADPPPDELHQTLEAINGTADLRARVAEVRTYGIGHAVNAAVH